MLTKEECEKALDHFEKCYWNQDCSYGAMSRVRKDLDILNKLIYEHFDNPPLKLEEIRPDDWIWDKKNKKWRQVNFAGIVGKDDELMFYEDVFKKGVKIVAFKDFRSVVFEENRFYRKEVKE